MPKENKKRGRRDEKKRKLEEEVEIAPETKRQKPEEDQEEQPDFLPLNEAAPAENGYNEGNFEETGGANATPFYGLLDEEEQEYFKRADELLDLNQFNDAEERNLFLANVYREADGKELKIANSQSCSRLMERLILLSNPAQLKALFGKFSGHFLHLVQHRFASHCCETLFIRSAPVVTQELVDPPEQQDEATGEVFVTMENLFLYALNELEGNLGYLIMDRFASHAVRVLLVVLSGKPLMKRSTTTVVQSRKKENITVTGMEGRPTELELGERTVPESFTAALNKMIKDTIAGLDTNHLRALATHPTGNPVLQLLLELELSKPGSRKQKISEQYLFRKLLPDDLTEGTDSAMFFNSMIYDPLGSRILETIIRVAPGKTFKLLYRNLLKERIGSLARNDIAGFVAMRALERLSKEDLQESIQSILPQIESLVERSRTTVIRTLVERCGVRSADTKALARALKEAYGQDSATGLEKMLKLPKKENMTAEEKGQKLHGSLLAQSMLNVPGPVSEIIQDGLVALGQETFIEICEDPVLSHVIQVSFDSAISSAAFRRRMLPKFYGNITRLATNSAGSHVIDSMWSGTRGLAFIREQVAAELSRNEGILRESYFGRAVWRNWKMDMYKRRRGDWLSLAKAREDGPESHVGTFEEPKKSGIDKARERFAAEKAKKEKKTRAEGKFVPKRSDTQDEQASLAQGDAQMEDA